MSRLLDASDIRFAYGAIDALRGVSVHLDAGEVVALIGPNGSGKSTLIKTLIAALHAKGDIAWERKPLRKWPRRELAKRVAYLAQSPMYEPGQTVAEALQLGRSAYWSLFGVESDRDVDVVRDVAARLELTDLLDRNLDQLSGGQRQMVFVGRALVQEPRAILLDEPSTFLDLKHQVELMTTLRKLAKEQNVGVLMASHDLNLAGATANRLILLDRGSVARDGTPSEVLDPELLQRVYGVELERIERADATAVLIKGGQVPLYRDF